MKRGISLLAVLLLPALAGCENPVDVDEDSPLVCWLPPNTCPSPGPALTFSLQEEPSSREP